MWWGTSWKQLTSYGLQGVDSYTGPNIRVQCPDFGAYLVAGFLDIHWQTQHGVDKGLEGEEKWDTPPPTLSRYPQMYQMSFLSVGVLKNFPAEGCRGRGATSTCRDKIGGLFCPPGRARACVKPNSPGCLPSWGLEGPVLFRR